MSLDARTTSTYILGCRGAAALLSLSLITQILTLVFGGRVQLNCGGKKKLVLTTYLKSISFGHYPKSVTIGKGID